MAKRKQERLQEQENQMDDYFRQFNDKTKEWVKAINKIILETTQTIQKEISEIDVHSKKYQGREEAKIVANGENDKEDKINKIVQEALVEKELSLELADLDKVSHEQQMTYLGAKLDFLKLIRAESSQVYKQTQKDLNSISEPKVSLTSNIVDYAQMAKKGFDQVRMSLKGVNEDTDAWMDLTSDVAGSAISMVATGEQMGKTIKSNAETEQGEAQKTGLVKALSGDIVAIVCLGLQILNAVFSFLNKKKAKEEEARKAEMKHRLEVLKAEQKQNEMVHERLFEEKQISKEKYQQAKENEKVNDNNKRGQIDKIDSMVGKQVDMIKEKLKEDRSDGSRDDLQEQIRDLEKLKELARSENGLEGFEGFITSNKNGKEFQDDIKGLYQDALQEQEKWAEETKKIQEEFIGATSQTFVDQWIEAFSAGEANAYDFSKNMQKVIRDSIIKGFAEEQITQAIAPVLAGVNKQIESYLLGDKELSELDFSQSLKDVANANDKIKALAPELSKLIKELGLEGITDAAQGMTGAIQGMSQETATVLAGQFNAIRVSAVNIEENLKDSMDITRRSIEHLGRIAANTDRLEAIERSLKNIEYNL